MSFIIDPNYVPNNQFKLVLDYSKINLNNIDDIQYIIYYIPESKLQIIKLYEQLYHIKVDNINYEKFK